MYIVLHVKYPLFLSDFNETWIFSTDFLKILKYKISWKSFNRRPNHSTRMDGQADMTKLIIALRNFVNMPKKSKVGPFRSMIAYVKVEVQLHSLTSALYRDCSERQISCSCRESNEFSDVQSVVHTLYRLRNPDFYCKCRPLDAEFSRNSFSNFGYKICGPGDTTSLLDINFMHFLHGTCKSSSLQRTLIFFPLTAILVRNSAREFIMLLTSVRSENNWIH